MKNSIITKISLLNEKIGNTVETEINEYINDILNDIQEMQE